MIRFSQFIKENANATLADKAKKSGFSLGILKQVYKRGMAAWKVGHKPGTTPQQWGMARVNSFITGGRTRVKGDPDLWAKQKGNIKKPKKEPKKEAYTMNEISTHKLNRYINKASGQLYHLGKKQGKQDMTPGYAPPTKHKFGLSDIERKGSKRVAGIMHATSKMAKRASSQKEDAAADKARADFFKRGGKITKLPPGKAAGYHGKDDPGKDMHGMMAKGDTKDFKKNKFVGSMK